MRQSLAAAGAATAQLAGVAGADVGMVGFLALTIPAAAAPERAGWIEPEARLWAAVIERAISDSCSQTAGPVRAEARRWLAEPSHGLHQVLLLVGFESSWWHAKVVPELRRRWETSGRQRGARWTAIPAPAAM